MYNYSVIIPHHNIPDLLERCLNSIPRRDDIQIIIVDDNSSPETVDFDNFPKSSRNNQVVILDKKGGGAGYARNKALDIVDAKWILFCDADDFFSENAFDIFDRYAEKEYDLILFKVSCVNSSTLKPTKRSGFRINVIIDAYERGFVSIEDIPFFNMAPWGKMISSKLVNDSLIRFDEERVSEDIMFSTKLACSASNVCVSNEVGYVLTERPGSLSSDVHLSKEKFLSTLQINVRRNKLLKEYHKKQRFLLPDLVDSLRIDVQTFKSAFLLLLTNGMLFSGFTSFLLYEFKTKIMKKECFI